jgi:hypothetical protein
MKDKTYYYKFDPDDPDGAPFDCVKFDLSFIKRGIEIKKLARELERDMYESYPREFVMEHIDEDSALYIAIRDIHQIAEGI